MIINCIEWSDAPVWAGAVIADPCGERYWVTGWGIASKRQMIGNDWIDITEADTASEGHAWALVSLRPKAWSGEGLPPVGAVCEIKRSPKWTEVEVIAHYEGQAVIAFDGDVELRDHFDLRPIRTPEQTKADERERAIQAIRDEIGYQRPQLGPCPVAQLYDASYRKQVAP